LTEGELALYYYPNCETISFKNSDGEIATLYNQIYIGKDRDDIPKIPLYDMVISDGIVYYKRNVSGNTFAYIKYKNDKHAYYAIDQTISDPKSMITCDKDTSVIEWIRNHSHRVLGYMSEESGFVYTQLNDEDTTLYADTNETAPIDQIGDVFVYIPKFYTKCHKYDSDHFFYELALEPDIWDDSWVKWGDTFIGAYKATYLGDGIYSRSGCYASCSLDQETFKEKARARGNGYSLITWKQHCLLAMLFCFYYGRTDETNVFKHANGNSTYTPLAGRTNVIGMHDMGYNDLILNATSFWGVEDCSSRPRELVDDIISDNLNWKVLDYDGDVQRILSEPQCSNGYITRFLLGDEFDCLPTKVSGTSSTYWTEYERAYSHSGCALCRAEVGNINQVTDNGLFCVDTYYYTTESLDEIGSRLSYNGDSTEVDSDTFEEIAGFNVVSEEEVDIQTGETEIEDSDSNNG
jgi:hypothetical protein